jgi:hypothetical protein
MDGRVPLKSKRMDGPRCWLVSRRFHAWVVWLVLLSVAAACASSKGTGIYEALSFGEKKKVLEELKQNWQDYNVYCDGPISTPGALIFDPKNDDRNLVGYRYSKLLKEESVRTAIVWMEFQLPFNSFLYRIFDEEKNFYGYVLVASELPTLKRVDPKTLELPSFRSTFYTP